MKILVATSEMAPFAKTGGLADVCGALPRALAELGHEVAVVLPFYGCIDRTRWRPELLFSDVVVDFPVGARTLAVWRAWLPAAAGARPAAEVQPAADVRPAAEDRPIPVYLIEDPGLFNRSQLYAEAGRDYPDNPLRFGYFCQAALWMLKALDWMPNIIHANDWQTALIPTLLAHSPALASDPQFGAIRVLFTIHNLGYQGIYPPHTLDQLGLPPALFNLQGLEFFGNVNLLKGGLITSHHLATVSRTYAREIQSPELGFGLEGVLRERADRLSGILNGIDTDEWNPETDPALPANFSRANKKEKALCKQRLQAHFGLPTDSRRPLLAMITRLANQKGLDLMREALPEILAGQVQFVLLGTGQPEYHEFFTELARRWPKRVGVELSFNNDLAHQIEAGADMFLMPSQFEPCGLNQLYSLRYGTVPIVRRTGGLADSIVNVTGPESISSGKATGFSFGPYKARLLLETVQKAIALYRNDRKAWLQLMDNGMAQDFSWLASAREYDKIIKKMGKP